MNTDVINFSARIETVTPDGCSAIARLDKNISGLKFVVISHDTKGRIAVMNGVGQFKPNVAVKGSAVIGAQALKALSVEEA
ncbi:MAG: hypothetical protein JKY82_10220 [Rhizobiaceae bacterium]|nr:hypothetical protein [Rhizobiaceae bacterium]